jgi:hypothetical protein
MSRSLGYGERQIVDTINYNKKLGINSISTPVSINQNLDAFQRLRVSLPSSQYEYNFQYNKAPLIWNEKITGTGTSVHQPALASIYMNTGSARTVSLLKQVGYGDASNGIFFGQDDTGVFVLLRSSVTGVVSDARKIYQENWNMDKFDGTGPSGVILDITKTQILAIDIQWLGCGRIRCGLEYNGILHYIHEFYNTNNMTTVYMTTANLPVRYSIVDGANGVVRQTFQYFRYRPGKSLQAIMTFNLNSKLTAQLDQICATVITETSEDKESYFQHSVNLGTTPKTINTTQLALISVRPKATFNGIVNRGSIFYQEVEISVIGSGLIRWQLIYNPTLGGSPSWVDGGTNSLFEYDISGTTITGGEIVGSGYCVSTSQAKTTERVAVESKNPLTLDMDGLNPKILTVAVVSQTGNVDVLGSMTMRSYY